MFAFFVMAAYDVPWAVLPWGNEHLVKVMALQNIAEAVAIVVLFWFLHSVVLVDEEVEVAAPDNIAEFKRAKEDV